MGALLVTTALLGAGTALAQTTAGKPAVQGAQASPAAAPVTFDIAAGPLGSALAAFGTSAGMQLLYPADLARGVTSPGVVGRLAPETALRRLLEGTGLTYRFTNATTITLVEAPRSSGAAVLPVIDVEGHRGATPSLAEPPEAYAGGQVARGARLGILGNRDFMDTPFSVTSITSATIQDQQATTLGEVVNNDPSVRMTGHNGGILDAFFIRGFPINEGNVGEVAFDGVYGVAPTYRVFTNYAERVEVIKGPTALIYGMAPNSAVGGTINIVPKRALETDLTRVTTDFTESSQFGTRVDVSRRYGPGREFGIRINGSYHDGETQLDNQSRTAYVGAVAADYAGERFRSSLDLIRQTEKFDAPSRPLFLAAGLATPSAPDAHRNITQAWEWSELTDNSGLLRGELDLDDSVTLFANLGGGRSQVDRLFGTPTIVNARGDTSVTPQYFIFEVDRVSADAGVRGRFETGPLRHTATLQATRYHDELSRGTANASQSVLSNIYNPVARAAQRVAEPGSVPKISETDLVGAALADTVSILDGRVQATVGVRRQAIESSNFNPATGAKTSFYDRSATTPLAGIVVTPWQNVAFYANYIEGLSKGDVAPTTAANAGEALAPYVTKQREVGVKLDFGRLAGTVSVFEMTKPSGQLAGTVFTAGGEQRNRGLEINLFGELAPGLRVLGGVTLLDAELTKASLASTVGNRPIGVPELQANLGLEWDASFLPGLVLGARAIYTGSQYVNTANTQSIPGWTRFDLGARYETMLVRTPATIRLTVRNLLDDDYWSGVSSFGGLGQGEPRSILLSTSFDF
jgi:iron complex outermembrane receptor protein